MEEHGGRDVGDKYGGSGAGNPSSRDVKNYQHTTLADDGTGGLLVVFCNSILGNCSFISIGSARYINMGSNKFIWDIQLFWTDAQVGGV